MILVRHGERSRHEGFAELQAVLQMDRDGTYFKASAPALRTAGINGPHIVLCGDWRPLDLDPSSRRGEEYLSRMFRAGCESTRDYLIAQLRSERHPRKAAELGLQARADCQATGQRWRSVRRGNDARGAVHGEDGQAEDGQIDQKQERRK